MRRLFRFFFPEAPAPEPPAWTPSPEQRRHLLQLLSEIGLHVVAEAKGPVPLATFGRRVMERLGPAQLQTIGPLPTLQFAQGLKVLIRDMEHEQLRILSPTDFPGVGYVFNATDPDTWPIRTSR
jgi:hypothetical protein